MAFEEMMNDPAIGGGPPQGPPQGPQMGGPPQGPQMGGPPQGMLQPGGPNPEEVMQRMEKNKKQIEVVLAEQKKEILGLRGEVNPLTQPGMILPAPPSMPPIGQLASIPPMGGIPGMPPMGSQGPPMPPMGGPPMGPIA